MFSNTLCFAQFPKTNTWYHLINQGHQQNHQKDELLSNDWFNIAYDSANKEKQYKEPSFKKQTNCQWTLD